MLYIVSTPIGNLKDITLRAIETLRTVDLIAAEDTRHTKILCDHFQINTALTSYFEHNKLKKGEYLLRLLKEGKNIALVTDSGTPGISDPGYNLIKLAQDNNITISVIPGATALIAALSLSGLPSDRFVFEGFLPSKTKAREEKLKSLKLEARTIVIYESPYRLVKALQSIEEVLENPEVVVAREITKKFEECKKGRASELIQYFLAHRPKGEFVILLRLN